MRQTQIFSGSSHPLLVEAICNRLGQNPGQAQLGKFSNGETKVQIETSIRDQDVFIVQSGSSRINDNVIELLIMVSACKSGSAKSITAVMPYFPYSRQSKKKSHRGSITARMVANLLKEAGVNHIITIDLHSSQMQGFFHCPVDNLTAEPQIANWVRRNIPEWQQAVVVSKNPGGTKRVTSLADALKLSFGIVMTDRRRQHTSGDGSVANSVILHPQDNLVHDDAGNSGDDEDESTEKLHKHSHEFNGSPRRRKHNAFRANLPTHLQRNHNGYGLPTSPLARSVHPEHLSPLPPSASYDLNRSQVLPLVAQEQADREDNSDEAEHEDDESEDGDDTENDLRPRSRDVITGRLVHGHIVDDNAPSPAFSGKSSTAEFGSTRQGSDEEVPDHMMSSFVSATSSHRFPDAGLGGSADAMGTSDEEEEDLKNPDLESMVTLVGNVRNRTVLIVDDMIDKSTSWIAAAETVVKRGGATKVYCIATHGLFGGQCLEEMEECACIDQIVITNAFPIPGELARSSNKLTILDVSSLLAEAIRRNHYGESISQLFQHFD